MKKVLFAVAAVALLTVAAQAGEIKYHTWPTGGYIPQELVTIPVKMDIGYWVRVKNQGDLEIKLEQMTTTTYYGCTDLTVECNFNLTISVEVAAITLPGGGKITDADSSLSVSIDDPSCLAPGCTRKVCVTLDKPNLTAVAGGTPNVHVADVTVKVVPAV